MRPVNLGKSMRMSYAQQSDVLEMPNLIEVQKNSYQWFLDEGLREVFADISPIADYSGQLKLEFVDFVLCEDDVKYSIEECKERDATYAAPLKVKVRLINTTTGEINQHDIFMGDLPLMTATGTFVINGAERVIVSQLVRSPGIYYGIGHDKIGKKLYSSTVIPNRGAWLEYETDSNDVFYVRVDRTRKVPITVLIRTLGFGTNAEITELFGEEPKLMASFLKDGSTCYQEGLAELYKKIRPGEPFSVDSAENLINSMFFDARRYDLAKVGRYKFNKKLALKNRITGFVLAEDVVDETTGEIIAEAGTKVTVEIAEAIQNAAIPSVMVQTETKNVKVLSNMMVDLRSYVDVDPAEVGVNELVYYPVLANILEEHDDLEDIKAAIKKNITELIPKHITKEDILASINYNIHLEYGIGSSDDIDHLGNRRIRAVGELLQNQYRIGLSRMERVVRERMTTQDVETISPQSLINIKPVTAAVKEFFGSSQLSQFMDQNNPLSELTHKRRLSALGPGGLSRDRAGFEVRDVHYTHYGRMCPIETPEGPNIGLINSLATYARINEYGFIEAPYRVLDKSDPKNPVVTDKVVYLTADEEDNYRVAQANEPLDENGCFVHKSVSGRYREETTEFDRSKIDLMDVSPKMVFSVATSMIPFLENDDANRALMGSNMQRQAVPLLKTEAPVVGTGMEAKAARDSGVCILATHDGVVERSTSKEIIVRRPDGIKDVYHVIKFSRSNQGNCMNQRPIVNVGETVKAGDVLADGASTANGEMAREKMLEKMELVEKPITYEPKIRIRFEPCVESGNDVLMVDNLSKSFGSQLLFHELHMDIKRGEKVALIGKNGTGKTTILKIINKYLAADTGRIALGAKVRIGYYDQEQQVLHDEKTIFEEISDAYPALTHTRIRNLLAAFLFTGDEVFKRISSLSGGEKGRVSLAKLMLSNANFLILDEPTNHLDLYSKEILEDAIRNYEGTVFYVSHDRYFINKTATRILDLTDKGLINYKGDYDYYLEKKEEGLIVPDSASIQKTETVSAAAGNSKEDWKQKKEAEREARKRANDLKKCETRIAELEAKLEELDETMALPENASSSAKLLELSREQSLVSDELEKLYELWETLAE